MLLEFLPLSLKNFMYSLLGLHADEFVIYNMILMYCCILPFCTPLWIGILALYGSIPSYEITNKL